jgi:hypothetical protein
MPPEKAYHVWEGSSFDNNGKKLSFLVFSIRHPGRSEIVVAA